MRAPGVPALAGWKCMKCFCLWAGNSMDVKPVCKTDCQTKTQYRMQNYRCWGLIKEPALT